MWGVSGLGPTPRIGRVRRKHCGGSSLRTLVPRGFVCSELRAGQRFSSFLNFPALFMCACIVSIIRKQMRMICKGFPFYPIACCKSLMKLLLSWWPCARGRSRTPVSAGVSRRRGVGRLTRGAGPAGVPTQLDSISPGGQGGRALGLGEPFVSTDHPRWVGGRHSEQNEGRGGERPLG